MANLRSLQSEADNLEQRAQGAQQEAQRIRADSAQQSAAGNPGQAQSLAGTAMNKEREAVDYSNKVQQKRAEMGSLQQKAQVLQNEINNKQRELADITGDTARPLF